MAHGALGAAKGERSDFYAVAHEHEREPGEGHQEAGVAQPSVGLCVQRAQADQTHQQQRQREDGQ